MKIVICWLISIADTLGVFSFLYMLSALGTKPTDDLGEYAAYIPNNPHYAIAGGIAASYSEIPDYILDECLDRLDPPLIDVIDKFNDFVK